MNEDRINKLLDNGVKTEDEVREMIYLRYPDVDADAFFEARETARIVGITRYTTAPERYDGFGTKTLEHLETTDGRGRNYREIIIPNDAIDWQLSRYGSGGFAALDEENYLHLTN